MWFQGNMGDRVVVMVVNDDVSIGFFRQIDGSVWVVVGAQDSYKFDEERPPVFWIDNFERHDLADSKRFQAMMEGIGDDSPPSYSGDSEAVFARLWHGKANEGYGMTPQLVSGSVLTLQVYTAEYDTRRYQFELNAPDLMKSVLNLKSL
jgi:hypothetical protein